jgi:hypothetical protein
MRRHRWLLTLLTFLLGACAGSVLSSRGSMSAHAQRDWEFEIAMNTGAMKGELQVMQGDLEAARSELAAIRQLLDRGINVRVGQ